MRHRILRQQEEAQKPDTTQGHKLPPPPPDRNAVQDVGKLHPMDASNVQPETQSAINVARRDTLQQSVDPYTK